MKKRQNTGNKTPQIQIGEFGPIYTNFQNKPKEAIKWLKKAKNGECTSALYRKEIGFIDIVYGEHNSDTNNGYGLCHIIAKHGSEIKRLGFEVEDFIPIIVQYGEIDLVKIEESKVVFKSESFKFVVKTKWNGKAKTFLLTSFDLLKKPTSKKEVG